MLWCHGLRLEFPFGLFGRVSLGHQSARPRVNKRGLRAVGLSDGRRALQDVVLGAQQLFESLVALLVLDGIGHVASRSRGRHVSSLLMMVLRPVILAREIQRRVQVKTQPLSKQRDTLLSAGGHRGDQFVSVQGVFLFVRVLGWFRRFRDAAQEFGRK